MEMSLECTKVVGAFISAQSSLEKASKDTENPFFKSKYADLNSIWLACQTALSENKLAAIQDVTTNDNGVAVSTRIVHESGEWLECGPLTVPLGKKDAQGVGSAITYGRRYGLSATLGIVADEDDDGNAAVKNAPKPAKPTVTVAEDSFKIKTSGYKDKEAAGRAWTKRFAEMCDRAEDTPQLFAVQADNMDTLAIFKESGMYDPIQMAIDRNTARLAPQAAE